MLIQRHQEAEFREGHLFPLAKVFRKIAACLAVSLIGSSGGKDTVTHQNVSGIQREVFREIGQLVASSGGGKKFPTESWCQKKPTRSRNRNPSISTPIQQGATTLESCTMLILRDAIAPIS